MTTNDDNIKWVLQRLQVLHKEREDARRANREVDHAACRIASESYLQDLLWAYTRHDEAQAEVERLKAEVERLKAEIQPRIERSIAFQDAMEEAEMERDEARAEVERLREVRQRGCDCNDEDACRFARERDEARAEVTRLQAAAHRAGQEAMRERCAALCDDWEEATYCDGWQAMELGAQHCAEAIRALEVE